MIATGIVGSISGDASAFCRSTTCTGDCERDADGCKTTGKKLSWKSACIGYSLQRDGTENIPMKHVRPAIARCFANWVDLECEDGTATISFSELDDVSCRQTEYNAGDEGNANIVLFQDTKWKYTSADNNLAKTTVTFDDESGEIFDADIEINHAYNYFTISDDNVSYDLESVVTHEVGHFIGLDHSFDFDATMNATYEKGSIELRTIELDDIDGACAAYPPDRDAACSTKPKGGLRDDCGQTTTEKADAESGGDEGCAVSAPGSPRPAGSSRAVQSPSTTRFSRSPGAGPAQAAGSRPGAVSALLLVLLGGAFGVRRCAGGRNSEQKRRMKA